MVRAGYGEESGRNLCNQDRYAGKLSESIMKKADN